MTTSCLCRLILCGTLPLLCAAAGPAPSSAQSDPSYRPVLIIPADMAHH